MEQYERFEMMRNMLVSDTDIKSKMTAKGYSQEEINAFFRGQRIVRKKVDSPRPTVPNTTITLPTDINKETTAAPALSINNTTPAKASNQGIDRFIMMRNMNISEHQIQDKMLRNGYSLTDIKSFFISHPSPTMATPISNNNSTEDLVDTNNNRNTTTTRYSTQQPPSKYLMNAASTIAAHNKMSNNDNNTTSNSNNNHDHHHDTNSISNNNNDITYYEPLDLSGFVEILSHTANFSPQMIETKMKSVGFTAVEIEELLNMRTSSSSITVVSPSRGRTLSVHGSHEENEHNINHANSNNNSSNNTTASIAAGHSIKSAKLSVPPLSLNNNIITSNNASNNSSSNSTSNKTTGESPLTSVAGSPFNLNTLPSFFNKNKATNQQQSQVQLSQTINNTRGTVYEMNICHTIDGSSSGKSQSDRNRGSYKDNSNNTTDVSQSARVSSSTSINGTTASSASTISNNNNKSNFTSDLSKTQISKLPIADDTSSSSLLQQQYRNTSSRSLRASESDTSVHELLKNAHLATIGRTAFKKSVSFNNVSPRVRAEKLLGSVLGGGGVGSTVNTSEATSSIRQSLISNATTNNGEHNNNNNDIRSSNMSVVSQFSTITTNNKNKDKTIAVVDVEDAYGHFVCEAYGTRTDTIKRH